MLDDTTWVGLSVLLVVGVILGRTPTSQRARTLDVLLAGLAGALLVGRLGHVALHWDYFAQVPAEAWQLRAGGLDWHGVVWGALGATWLMARLRRIAVLPLWGQLAWAAPVITLGAWLGCGVAACAYGREVGTLAAYPAWLVWDAPDVYGLFAPRFFTPLLGGVAAAASLGVMIGGRTSGQPQVRLGISLLLLAVTMAAIGFLRGDSVLMMRELRADLWLDGAMLVTGVAVACLPPAGFRRILSATD